MYKLSIIVPIYNVEKYINQCLDSIVNNYQSGIEVLLVNDGTKDNSAVIAKEYCDKYEFFRLINQPNGGLSRARNTGINEAKGEYVMFLDSDDWISDNALSLILAKLHNIDALLINHYGSFDNEDIVYGTYQENDETNIIKFIQAQGNVSYAAVRTILKRQLILDHDLYFHDGLYHEDELWSATNYLFINSFKVIEKPLYHYRQNVSGSIMNKVQPKRTSDKLIIVKLLANNLAVCNSELATQFINERIANIYISALNELCLYNSQQQKEFIRVFKANYHYLANNTSKKARIVGLMIKVLGYKLTSKILNKRNQVKD